MGVHVTKHARQRLFERLGTQAPPTWWNRLAGCLSDATRLRKSYDAEVHHIHARGPDGEDVGLEVVVEWTPEVVKVVSLWVTSVDGEIEGPTWGRTYEAARKYVEELWKRLT